MGLRLALLDLGDALRAVAQAGAEAIAEEVAHQPRLAVDHLDCPLRAVGYAEAAAVALFMVNLDDFPLHGFFVLNATPLLFRKNSQKFRA